MKFRTFKLAISLLAFSVTALGAHAADVSTVTTSAPEPVMNQAASDGEISASPKISKATVRQMEREKEKNYHGHESFSERALMLTKGTLSY